MWKKRILEIATILAFISQIGLFLSTEKYLILLFLIFNGLALGTFMAIRGPIITTISKLKKRGSVFEIFSAVSDLIGIFGGLIVGYIVDYYSNKIVFIIIGLLSIFSLILSCTMSIDEKTFAPSKTVTNKVMKTSFSGFSLLLIIMLLVNIIQTTVSAPLWEIVIPLYTSELFEKATITIGVLYSIDSFFSIAASFFFW